MVWCGLSGLLCNAGPQSAERTKIIIAASTVSAVVAILLAVAAVLAHLLRRSRRGPDNLKCSLSSLRKLGSSANSSLSFELDKNKNLILLGRGGFGEVGQSTFLALKGRHPKRFIPTLPLNADQTTLVIQEPPIDDQRHSVRG